jgi:hypothetical protein
MLNYSVFMKLLYADNHLSGAAISSFEDFYSNLVSACDLAEEFLQKCYLLFRECVEEEVEFLERLSKNTFLAVAGDWYDRNYTELYANYYSKGKANPIRIPNRKHILDEYYQGNPPWKEYKVFSQSLRTFRNVIVHETLMGQIVISPGVSLVPQKGKIKQYKRITDVLAIINNQSIVQRDFIVKSEQMQLDINELKRILNLIWDKPLKEFVKLFYEDRNNILLKKFDIELVD